MGMVLNLNPVNIITVIYPLFRGSPLRHLAPDMVSARSGAIAIWSQAALSPSGDGARSEGFFGWRQMAIGTKNEKPSGASSVRRWRQLAPYYEGDLRHLAPDGGRYRQILRDGASWRQIWRQLCLLLYDPFAQTLSTFFLLMLLLKDSENRLIVSGTIDCTTAQIFS
jgi:hypothetical protein